MAEDARQLVQVASGTQIVHGERMSKRVGTAANACDMCPVPQSVERLIQSIWCQWLISLVREDGHFIGMCSPIAMYVPVQRRTRILGQPHLALFVPFADYTDEALGWIEVDLVKGETTQFRSSDASIA
jgi:hypothetical protein